MLDPIQTPNRLPHQARGEGTRLRHHSAATTIAAGPTLRHRFTNVADRLITGFSATFLLRFLAQSLGLIRVGGGRGFWFFAEVDTIVFDLVLLYVIIHCIRALRDGTARGTPLLVLLILVFAITGGLMSYTVNNFGTLIRLRQMLYAMAVVTPVTLLHPAREENATSAGERYEGEEVYEEV
jgi:hypothetical protein